MASGAPVAEGWESAAASVDLFDSLITYFASSLLQQWYQVKIDTSVESRR